MPRICTFAVALLTSVTALNSYGEPSSQATPNDARIDQLERRLNDLEDRHQRDLKSRDEEIARLRLLLEQQGTLPPGRATTQPAENTDSLLKEIDAAGDRVADADRTRAAVTSDAALRSSFSGSFNGSRTPISFNPDFAVVGDFGANLSTDHANPARNRFDIGSVELDLRAAVDPRADGVVILPVSHDLDDPLFFRSRADSTGKTDTSIDIEEAYLFLHDFGVPNLTAKLGKFHLRFGRENILHSHDWPTVDNNFVNQSFLGSESLNDAGLSLSYVIPPKLLANQYVELIAEIVSGEGSSDNPVLNNDAYVQSPALNLHALWNHDFGPWNLELGGSYLTAKHNGDNRQNANLFGADVTLLHTDPTGRFNNQLIQAEAIYGVTDTSRFETQHSFGAYLLAQQQLNRDWYAGVRLDWTKNAMIEKQEVWGVSPYVTWYWSEFLRFRAEYQHKAGDVKHEDTLYFQVVFIYGAHPPHPYWALR